MTIYVNALTFNSERKPPPNCKSRWI